MTGRRIVNTKDKGGPLPVPQPVGVVALLLDPGSRIFVTPRQLKIFVADYSI